MSESNQAQPLTEEEIARLPRWFAVALAARCAMRVQPMVTVDSFGEESDEQIARHIEAVDTVVLLSAASTANTNTNTNTNANAVYDANAAYAAYAVDGVDATESATIAADAAGNTIAAATNDANVYTLAALAVEATAYVADVDAARTDYQWLMEKASSVKSDDAVDPAFFNRPLWPDERSPERWDEKIERWQDGLAQLDQRTDNRFNLIDIYQRHAQMLKGGGIDFEAARRRIDEWMAKQEEQKQKQEEEQQPKQKELKLKKKQSASQQKTPPPLPEASEKVNENQAVENLEPSEAGETTETPEAADRRGAPTSMRDAPSAVDHLGRSHLVDALSAMFAARQQATPFTMALLGDWGAGKSSVMVQIQEKLSQFATKEGVKRFHFTWFNAWEYEHTADIRAGLAQEVVKGLTQKVGFIRRFWLKVGFAWSENRWPFLQTIGGLAALIAFAIFGLPRIQSLFQTSWIGEITAVGGGAAAIGVLVYLWKHFKPIFDHPLAIQLQTYLQLPDYRQHLGVIPVMKRHLKTLCELRGVKDFNIGGNSRLIVFVDDLDRCGVKCITQTFDAIRLVMDISEVIVVIAIDHRIAFRAVADHYKTLAHANRSKNEIARDYLGKIIQLPVMLSKPTNMDNFIEKYLFPTVDGEKSDRPPASKDKQPPTRVVEPRDLDDKDKTKPGDPPPDITKPPNVVKASQKSSSDVEQKPAPAVEPKPKPAPVLMPASPEDRPNFQKWTGNFALTNPRQLIRLRNTYRLLVQLNHNTKLGYDDEFLLAMLFWLDYLNQFPEMEHQAYEKMLLKKTKAPAKNADPTTRLIRKVGDEITGHIRRQLKQAGQSNAKSALAKNIRIQYDQAKALIHRFVLPHGYEDAPNDE